jgi:hypothetical protein
VESKALSKAGKSFKLGVHVITAPAVILAARIQRDNEKKRVEAKEVKAAAKDDSTEADAISTFESWRSKGRMQFKLNGKDVGQPDMDKSQMKIILAYLLKKGGFDEAISAHNKNRSTLWERLLKFGADNDDGKRNWVGQMQHLKETFWKEAPVEKLLKQPPLFKVDTSMEGGCFGRW